MTTAVILAIAIGIAFTGIAAVWISWSASRDPLDRRSSRQRASQVLRSAVASVPANAFDARLHILRSAG